MPYILIIDDVVELRHTLAELLGFEGFDVRESENPLDAYACMVQCRPDIIMIDLGFADYDGIDFIRRVRCNPLFATIAIIAISSFSDAVHIAEALSCGANDYLVKPFIATTMLDSIQNLIAPAAPYALTAN
ncbi:MAG: response regulator [Chloroflexota bacterium]